MYPSLHLENNSQFRIFEPLNLPLDTLGMRREGMIWEASGCSHALLAFPASFMFGALCWQKKGVQSRDLEGRKLPAMVAHTVEMQQKSEHLPSHISLDHLLAKEKERYGHKRQMLGTCNPYTAPAAVFFPLKTARFLYMWWLWYH